MSESSKKPARVTGAALDHLSEMVWVGDIPSLGARQYPDRLAIIFSDRQERATYAQLDAQADACADLVRSRGLKADARVAYLGRNNDLFYPALFGAIRANVVLVPINWRLAPPEIRFQLADSGAQLLICDPELAAAARQAAEGLPGLLPLQLTEGNDGLRALLSRRAAPHAAAHDRSQVILQLYTSGTTGQPKGVLVSHGALSIARHAELMSPDFSHLASGCTLLSAMPNFHIGGLSWVLMGLVRMGTVVITADASAANLLNLIREYAVEHSWMVPTLIRTLVDTLHQEQRDAPKITGLFYGAMPMDSALLRQSMRVFGCSFLQFYGMTENSGSTTALAPADHDLGRPELLKSVGKPYPGMSVEIRGADRRVLNCGEPGEIWIQSPTLMLGYWNLPSQTAASLVEGWYASGDGGYIDEQGFVFLTDRIKDMIISGGENVYPAEVEEALRQHAAVLEVAVVGVPDRRWGEKIVAVVELRPGQILSADELIGFSRRQIASYKCPKLIEFTAALPRTASGKVQRAVVRQQLVQRAAIC